MTNFNLPPGTLPKDYEDPVSCPTCGFPLDPHIEDCPRCGRTPDSKPDEDDED